MRRERRRQRQCRGCGPGSTLSRQQLLQCLLPTRCRRPASARAGRTARRSRMKATSSSDLPHALATAQPTARHHPAAAPACAMQSCASLATAQPLRPAAVQRSSRSDRWAVRWGQRGRRIVSGRVVPPPPPPPPHGRSSWPTSCCRWQCLAASAEQRQQQQQPQQHSNSREAGGYRPRHRQHLVRTLGGFLAPCTAMGPWRACSGVCRASIAGVVLTRQVLHAAPAPQHDAGCGAGEAQGATRAGAHGSAVTLLSRAA